MPDVRHLRHGRVRLKLDLMLEPTLVIAFVVGMFALLSGLGRVAGMQTNEHLCCPNKGQDADVVFRRRLTATWAQGACTDVVRCSALLHPTCVTCNKACLQPKQPYLASLT